MTSTNSPI